MLDARSPDTFSGIAVLLPQGTSATDVVAFARLDAAGRFGDSDWRGYYFQPRGRGLHAAPDDRGHRLMLLALKADPRVVLIALGPVSEVAEVFVETIRREWLVRKAVFRVDRIVSLATSNSLVTPSPPPDGSDRVERKPPPDQPYRLSYAQGRISVYGDALTSVALYGKDVTRAQLFAEISKEVSWYYCGIRSPRGAEIVKVGSDAGVICAGLSRTGRRRVERLERVQAALETFLALGLIRV